MVVEWNRSNGRVGVELEQGYETRFHAAYLTGMFMETRWQLQSIHAPYQSTIGLQSTK
jgi:hypothetical protein